MRGKFVISAIVLLASLHAPIASARQWVTISYNPLIAIDVDSIKGEGATRTFWNKVIFDEDKGSFYFRYRSITALTYVDCDARKMGHLNILWYDSDGDLVRTEGDSDLSVPLSLTSVVPDTIGELELDYVCRLRTDARSRTTLLNNSANNTLNQQQAVNLLKRWLQAKNSIFASPFSRQLINELTTGALHHDLIKADGPVNWLKNNNAYYRYHIQTIDSIRSFSIAQNKATLEARVTEDRTLYEGNRINREQSGRKMYIVRYSFERVNGVWKIADYIIAKNQNSLTAK
jgi:hypothetical protein